MIASNGRPGDIGNKTGKQGQDEYLHVPLGTVVYDDATGQKLAEILEDGQTQIVARGGSGGLGNTHFKSATKQAPRYAQSGEEGEDRWIVLELKMLADVGLVGFPNAGKSTLLSALSAAKPKVADYPFTTTKPNLGMVPYHDFKSFLMADIPGLIEGAHAGKGLGDRFLRHIERNGVLLFTIPADSDNIKRNYDLLLKELEQFNRELLVKDRLLAITKSDLLDEELKQLIIPELPDVPYVLISSVTEEGLLPLKDNIWTLLNKKVTSSEG
jgi:GTP-binding protein